MGRLPANAARPFYQGGRISVCAFSISLFAFNFLTFFTSFAGFCFLSATACLP